MTVDELLLLGQLVRELNPHVGKEWQHLVSQHFPGRSFRSLSEKVSSLRQQAGGDQSGDSHDRHSFRFAFERAVLRHGDLDWVEIKHDLLDAERQHQEVIVEKIRKAEKEGNSQKAAQLRKQFLFFPTRRDKLRQIWAQWYADCTQEWTTDEVDLLMNQVKLAQRKQQKQQAPHTHLDGHHGDRMEELSPEIWVEIGRRFIHKSPYQCQVKWSDLVQGGTDDELYAEILDSVWSGFKGLRLDSVLHLDTDAHGKPMAAKRIAEPVFDPFDELDQLAASKDNNNNSSSSSTTTTSMMSDNAHLSSPPPRASKVLARLLAAVQARPASDAQWDDYEGFDPHTDNWTRHEIGLLLQAVEKYGTHFLVFERVGELLGMDTVRVMCQWLLSRQNENAELTALVGGTRGGRGPRRGRTEEESDGDQSDDSTASPRRSKATGDSTSPKGKAHDAVSMQPGPAQWTQEMDRFLLDALETRPAGMPMTEVYQRVADKYGLSLYSASNRHRRLRRKESTMV